MAEEPLYWAQTVFELFFKKKKQRNAKKEINELRVRSLWLLGGSGAPAPSLCARKRVCVCVCVSVR